MNSMVLRSPMILIIKSFYANNPDNDVVTNLGEEASALGGHDLSKLSFTVSGEADHEIDFTLPQISNLNLSTPNNYDENPQFVNGQASFIYLEIEDAHGDLNGQSTMYGSGGYHSIGELNFRSANGRQRLDVNIQPNHLVQGDKFSGTYKVPIFLNDATESGTWALEGVYLRDDSGNYQNIDRDIGMK